MRKAYAMHTGIRGISAPNAARVSYILIVFSLGMQIDGADRARSGLPVWILGDERSKRAIAPAPFFALLRA
jgi:hypothetical protein